MLFISVCHFPFLDIHTYFGYRLIDDDDDTEKLKDSLIDGGISQETLDVRSKYSTCLLRMMMADSFRY